MKKELTLLFLCSREVNWENLPLSNFVLMDKKETSERYYSSAPPQELPAPAVQP